MDTLAFGCILPTTGWIRDFHPLERAPTGRTKNRPADVIHQPGGSFTYYSIMIYKVLLAVIAACAAASLAIGTRNGEQET